MNIRKFYEGKNVLLTGVTGFLGKVILEKLMRNCPGINKFYIMVRQKRNKKPFDRIKNEILNSYVFSVVKKQHEDFYSWAQSKIVPIVGDLVVDNLGMSDIHREMVVNDCHIIINSAASVNFDDHLHDALAINYFGSLRMLELAKECKNLVIHTHISTCYVNSTRTGYIKEEIYDLETMDVDAKVKNIMGMNH